MAEQTELKGPSNPYLLIDGDIFLYRCGFAVEKTKYLVTAHYPECDWVCSEFDTAKEAKEEMKYGNKTLWSRREVEPVENALEATRKALQNVCEKFPYNPGKGDKWVGQIYLTGKGNFRENIEAERGYKDNRDPGHRPKHYRAIKEYLVKNWGAKIVNGMEADDAIGIDAYSRPIDGYIVVSNDKDLDQISGFHYDWTKEHLYFVNDEDSLKMFYKQLLCGDPTDNIKGVISEEKADELIDPLSSPHDCARVAKEVYEKKYGELWSDKLDVTGELVWIRKDNWPSGKLHNPFWSHLNGP